MNTTKPLNEFKVYVAGKLNADAVGYIKNCHRMIKTARRLRGLGFCVYVPCIDFLEGLVDGNFTYSDYFDNSQPWLLVSQAVFLTPGWEDSNGTRAEMATATKNGIFVTSDETALLEYAHSIGYDVMNLQINKL